VEMLHARVTFYLQLNRNVSKSFRSQYGILILKAQVGSADSPVRNIHVISIRFMESVFDAY